MYEHTLPIVMIMLLQTLACMTTLKMMVFATMTSTSWSVHMMVETAAWRTWNRTIFVANVSAKTTETYWNHLL